MSRYAPHHHPLLVPVVLMLVAIGRLIGCLLPLRNRSGLFFFFPFYHTGGAERVHSQIVSCFKDQQPWIFFAKRSGDARFYRQFSQAGRCFDIGWLLKYSYPLSVGILAGLIGKHPDARVFGCNSLFYYLLLPHLPEHVRATDLLHALGGGAEQFALPVLERLQQRVVISLGVQNELVAWYRSNGVDPGLEQRITVIPNQVEIPQTVGKSAADGVLRLLYVGRGGDEKRVHLIGRAARICTEQGLAVEVTLAGDLDDAIAAEDRACCRLTGLISVGDQLSRLYQQADLLLITSSREGFPLTVMEGMAHGCVPVCTAVGGIPEHIRHQENGWLLPAGDDEAVVHALVQAVQTLSDNRHLLQQLSTAARHYADTRFSGEHFCEQYRDVIKGV
jgi:glycosyltransferase involved in cell wall biosynthesis